MNFIQKWRARKHDREIKKAINKYNETLSSLAEAATTIIDIARQSGIATASMESAVSGICEVAKTGTITIEDFKTGGANNVTR